MRTITIELVIKVPARYKLDKGNSESEQVNTLLDELEDRYSDVSLIESKITGEQNDGKEE